MFNGTEKITVGGGEALWLYINKVLVIEIVSTSTDCYRIDLSPAAYIGTCLLKIYQPLTLRMLGNLHVFCSVLIFFFNLPLLAHLMS